MLKTSFLSAMSEHVLFCFDPATKQCVYITLYQLIRGRNSRSCTLVGSQSCAGGLFIENGIQVSGVVFVQAFGVIDAIVYMETFIHQVLIERVVEIEMIEGVEIELGEIAVHERDIPETQFILHLVSNPYEITPLFYAVEITIIEIIGGIQAEFAYAGADIEDVGTRCHSQERCRLPGNFDRRPVEVR